jgi:hypothetical protein
MVTENALPVLEKQEMGLLCSGMGLTSVAEKSLRASGFAECRYYPARSDGAESSIAEQVGTFVDERRLTPDVRHRGAFPRVARSI